MNANVHKDALVSPTLVPQSQTDYVIKDPYYVTAGGSKYHRLDIYVGKTVVAAAISGKLQHSSGYNIWDDTKTVSITASTNTNISAVSTSANTLTVTSHGLANNDPIILTQDAAGQLPGGLDENTIYYARVVDANTIAVRQEVDGPDIDITSAGSGTNSITEVRVFSIKFLPEVAGDQTYLPLKSVARLTVTTGAGDSVQLVSVRVIQEN